MIHQVKKIFWRKNCKNLILVISILQSAMGQVKTGLDAYHNEASDSEED